MCNGLYSMPRASGWYAPSQPNHWLVTHKGQMVGAVPRACSVLWSVNSLRLQYGSYSRARGNPGGPPGLDPGVRRDDIASLHPEYRAERATSITRSKAKTTPHVRDCA